MGTVINIEKEIKKRRRKEFVREKWESAKNFASNNKEAIMILGPSIIGLGTAVVKGISKHKNLKKQEHVKNNYCYDRSLGHYWQLRRELTNAEWVEVDRRKKNGERLADILDSLKVLK